MKLLFVVHRSHPAPGGSEFNVKILTSELAKRGHVVKVLSDCAPKSSYDGVTVITDRNELFKDYDWIIIHGADMPLQNFALSNLSKLKSKTLHWIIFPSESSYSRMGQNCTKIGWGSKFDLDYIRKCGVEHKSGYLRYSMNECFGDIGFKQKYGIQGRIFLSGGGFSVHKHHKELAESFIDCMIEGTTLVLSGYLHIPPKIIHPNVKTLMLSRNDYLSALKEADLYILNSTEEGFGLVLLEAMLNKVPWISTPVGGAPDMKEYGTVYYSDSELKTLLTTFNLNRDKVLKAYNYVTTERTPTLMGDDFMKIVSPC